MAKSSDDEGTIQVLLERLDKWRLPRVLDLKEKIDGGETLNDSDLAFLDRVLEDANSIMPLADRNPEYQALAVKIVALYNDITKKALENEKGS